MKPVRITIIVSLIIAVAGVAAWRSQWFFLHNKATYLLNQRQYDRATDLIESLNARNPDNPRTNFMQVKAATITGEFDEAIQVASSSSEVVDSEMLYWLAVAQYQTGHAEEAEETARRFLDSGDTLRGASQKIASALASETRIVDPSTRDSLDFRLLFDVEKAVYLGLAGLHQWEIGRLDLAARLLRDAFVLGNRNPRFLKDGAFVLALVGDVQGSQMFWDYSGAATIAPLHKKLHQQYDNYRGVSLTLDSEDLAQGGRKIDVARALAWSVGLLVKEDPESMTSDSLQLMENLLMEFPYDPVLQIRHADLFEAASQPDKALSIYSQVQEKNPSFTVLVKMMGVEGRSETEFSQQTTALMQELEQVVTLQSDDWDKIDGEVTGLDIRLDNSGATTGTVQLKQRGSYMLTVVAKSTQEQGRWPILQVLVNGEVAGYNYISRPTWETYNLALPLEAGTHTIELLYDIPNEEPSNRSILLRSLYLTLSGVAYVR